MHYYIDGYNWLFRTPKTPESLEIRRRAFIHAIHELVLDRNCLVTLVFDSSDPSRDISSKGNYRSLEIVFTPKKQTADQYIEQAVESAQQPKNITVVTLDRELRDKCRLRGSQVLSMKEFQHLFSKKRKVSQEKQFQDIPSQTARLLKIFEKKLLDDLSHE